MIEMLIWLFWISVFIGIILSVLRGAVEEEPEEPEELEEHSCCEWCGADAFNEDGQCTACGGVA